MNLLRSPYLTIVIALFAGVYQAGAGEQTKSQPAYPLWDGAESVADYAKKVNLPATKTLDLGGGVKMELVLIPAGKFIMGTPEPTPVDEDGFRKKIIAGQVLLAVSGAVLLGLLCAIIVVAIRKRQRPKYSLLWLLAMTVAAGGCVLNGLHWRQSARDLEQAKMEFRDVKTDYDNVAEPDSKPPHRVTITAAFYMGKFEITQEQYQQVTETNPSSFKGKDNPVENVSWDDAQSFCARLSAQTKQTVRLPTEAEWEYACRDDVCNPEFPGLPNNKELDEIAWYSGNSQDTTHPVGQKKPNKFGLYDMHGNVWEWCQDWHGHAYYNQSPTENPPGAAYEEPGHRVIRGGSWQTLPYWCRAVYRNSCAPEVRVYDAGFRVVVAGTRK